MGLKIHADSMKIQMGKYESVVSLAEATPCYRTIKTFREGNKMADNRRVSHYLYFPYTQFLFVKGQITDDDDEGVYDDYDKLYVSFSSKPLAEIIAEAPQQTASENAKTDKFEKKALGKYLYNQFFEPSLPNVTNGMCVSSRRDVDGFSIYRADDTMNTIHEFNGIKDAVDFFYNAEFTFGWNDRIPRFLLNLEVTLKNSFTEPFCSMVLKEWEKSSPEVITKTIPTCPYATSPIGIWIPHIFKLL